MSKQLLFGMLCLIGAMAYIVRTEANIPGVVIALGGALGLMALFFASLRRPELPLYVMVAYLPFSKLLSGSFGGAMMALNLTNLLLLIVLASWFTSVFTSGRALIEPHVLHVPVALLVAWAFAIFAVTTARLGGEYAAEYANELKRWLDPFIVYVAFFHLVRDKQRWKNLVVILMMGVTMVALMAIHEYLSRGEASIERMRVGGITQQPNILGAFFVYYMFLFTAFWLERMNQLKSWLLLIPFGLCFRGIMVTFSRGAYLAFAQGCLGLAFFKNKLLFLLATGAIVFAVFNPWILPPGIQYRLQSTFKSQTELTDPYGTAELEEGLDASSANRILIWKGAQQMIQEHPWTGVGLGRFSSQIGQYMQQVRWYDAHNAYIITAAEMGIPALILFIVMILVIFWITYVVYTHHPDPFIRATALGFLGGLSGLLMANMFGSRLNTSEASGYFWVLAALMARAYAWVEEERGKQRVDARARRRSGLRTAGSAAVVPRGIRR